MDWSMPWEDADQTAIKGTEERAAQDRAIDVNLRPPGEYMNRDPYRQNLVEDIGEAGRMARVGGPATRAAKDIQREQAAGQVALARGSGGSGGGAGMRMGSEAGGESYVQSMAPAAITAEAEKQGYTREEAGAAGMLAMDDNQFRQQIDQMMAQKKRGAVQEEQGRTAGAVGTIASVIGMFSDKRAKENTRPISPEATDEFMNMLRTGAFDYKEGFGGGKGNMGPLLDDAVAETEVGRSFISRDPKTGLLVSDPNKAALTTLALLKKENEDKKFLAKRLEALEQASPGAAYARRYPQSIPLPGTPYVPVAKTDIPGTPGASWRKIPGRLPFRDLPPSPGGVYTKGARPGASPQPQESGFTQEDAKSFMDMLSKGKKGKK